VGEKWVYDDCSYLTPFAFSRFCKANDVKNINTLSDYKGASNARKYGSVIASPKFC
jgi:peroxiredoxin